MKRTFILEPDKLPASSKDIYVGCFIGYLQLRRRVRSNPKDSAMRRKKWRVTCHAPGCGKDSTIPQSYMLRRPTPKLDCGCVAKNNQSLQAQYKREHGIWYMMNRRCTDEGHVAYHHYGGRGICVATEWQKDTLGAFEAWFEYLGPATTSKHTLDRIDVDGNYAPGNVRWATATQQALNTRKQKYARLAAEQRLLEQST